MDDDYPNVAVSRHFTLGESPLPNFVVTPM